MFVSRPEEHHPAQICPRDVREVWLGGDLDAAGEDSSKEHVVRGGGSGADGEHEGEAVLGPRVVRHAAEEAAASHGVGGGVDAAEGMARSDAGSEKFHPVEGHLPRAVEDVPRDGALEGALEHGHELLEGELLFLLVVVAHHVHLLEGFVRADARHGALVEPESLRNLGVLEELAHRLANERRARMRTALEGSLLVAPNLRRDGARHRRARGASSSRARKATTRQPSSRGPRETRRSRRCRRGKPMHANHARYCVWNPAGTNCSENDLCSPRHTG